MTVDLELTDRAVIVTGASRGLGRAIAAGLAAQGAQVLAVARSTADLATLAEETPNVVVQTCDLADLDQVRSLAAVALERFGRLDGVVNNAGIAPAASFRSLDLDDFRRTLEVNVLAPAALMQAAGEVFVPQRAGKVVNIGSLSSLRGKPTLSAYSASKGALLRLTEAVSGEWAKHGVQVNMIAPGGFETAAQQAVLDDPELLLRRTRKIPAGRLGQPEEVVGLTCLLLSPASDFITGSCYTIDGGEFAKL